MRRGRTDAPKPPSLGKKLLKAVWQKVRENLTTQISTALLGSTVAVSTVAVLDAQSSKEMKQTAVTMQHEAVQKIQQTAHHAEAAITAQLARRVDTVAVQHEQLVATTTKLVEKNKILLGGETELPRMLSPQDVAAMATQAQVQVQTSAKAGGNIQSFSNVSARAAVVAAKAAAIVAKTTTKSSVPATKSTSAKAAPTAKNNAIAAIKSTPPITATRAAAVVAVANVINSKSDNPSTTNIFLQVRNALDEAERQGTITPEERKALGKDLEQTQQSGTPISSSPS